jgi:predicted dehydrogenase
MTKGMDSTSERAVVVGAGDVSNRWFRSLAEERVEVAGVVDLSLETASSQIAKYGLSRAEAFTELKEALRKCKPDFVLDLRLLVENPARMLAH